MKIFRFLPLVLLFLACKTVSVSVDYDKEASFESIKTYAFLKTSVDKLEISDLDKKRILRSIDEVMQTKGFAKSENPDVLISLFTKEKERIDIYNSFNYGWGWHPFYGANYSHVSRTPEGTLIIDILDAKNRVLLWQGIGKGYLTQNPDQKDERIKTFVSEILMQFPPTKK